MLCGRGLIVEVRRCRGLSSLWSTTADKSTTTSMIMDVSLRQLIQEQGSSARGSTYRVLGLAAICIALTTCVGCRHGAKGGEVAPAQGVEEQERDEPRTSTEQILFDAIVAELASRGYALESVSEQFLTVVTGYEEVSARLRKRRVVKVIVLPRGGALNVRVSYERDGGESSWQEVVDERTRERAGVEEMELARAIEERFHALQRERR